MGDIDNRVRLAGKHQEAPFPEGLDRGKNIGLGSVAYGNQVAQAAGPTRLLFLRSRLHQPLEDAPDDHFLA